MSAQQPSTADPREDWGQGGLLQGAERDSRLSLPDRAIFIVEGGVAGVVDECPDTPIFAIFQNNVLVYEGPLFRAEDEHSQVA